MDGWIGVRASARGYMNVRASERFVPNDTYCTARCILL